MSPHHTYGPRCQLAWDARPPVHNSTDSSPPVKAQFFYQSALPIDDPLSVVPLPSSASSSAVPKHPLRPFSAHDNAALEEAWQRLGPRIPRVERSEGTERDGGESQPSRSVTEPVMVAHGRRRRTAGIRSGFERQASPLARDIAVSRMHRHVVDEEHYGRLSTSVEEGGEQYLSVRSGASRTAYGEEVGIEKADEAFNHGDEAVEIDVHKPSRTSPLLEPSSPPLARMSHSPYRGSLSEKTTTGTPFLRAPPRSTRSPSPDRELELERDNGKVESEGHAGSPAGPSRKESASNHQRDSSTTPSILRKSSSAIKSPAETADESLEVPVGISRLHVVELPGLEMKPIYWSALNDISLVIRGTWFYGDTMFPVEAEVANQLEVGYLQLKVWTETWKDELNSAVAVGAEGEAKIVHRIWPKEEPKRTQSGSRPGTGTGQGTNTPRGSVSLTNAEDLIVRSTGTRRNPEGLSHVAAEGHQELAKGKNKRYASWSVIYKNEREAFILRPSLLPSAYYGRRPLAKIRKGVAVGIPVVRGFDWKTWHKIHPSKNTSVAARAEEGAATSQSGTANLHRGRGCPACLAAERQEKVTDLILVIHGIGQKLSERMESFSFTHLVNNLRREIHIELGNPTVKPLLRPNHGGIMALPINWRSLLSFDDGGMSHAHETGSKFPNEFNLKDITPDSIPSVRNLISDVMFDIPYYLSHHKPEMIEAVVGEANRVYRLWCKNNPGFQTNGRVHVIAHSLGSVMALDILSKQPTRLPDHIDLTSADINTQSFDFDTKNLFFCGSPAGFFLLLNKGSLIPRKGRNKLGQEGEDAGRRIAGEAGTYGCLAVDNIYNVLNYYDPIAYRLNATVDTNYAASLQPALIPSASTSFLSSVLGNAFRPFTSSHNPPPSSFPFDPSSHRPDMSRLASTIELETHNFTREEIAEKRMYLLNENGQIDYFLNIGTSPLEIQYLNILSAHSSYWLSRDFVRFLVQEIARPPGREATLRGMRAVKRRVGGTNSGGGGGGGGGGAMLR